MNNRNTWLLLVCAVITGPVCASPLFFSQDTLYERGYFSHFSTDEAYLVNRGESPAQINSLEVVVDRSVFKSVSMIFTADTKESGRVRQERVFYWDDGESVWLSRELVVPPGDSIRIHSMTVDQCPRCAGRRPPSVSSREIEASVHFKSNRGAAKVVVKGWYYLL